MWHNVQVRKSFQGRWKYAETCTNPILHKRHRKRGFLKKVGGEGENAANQAFSPFPTMFSVLPKTNFTLSVTFILLSANAFLLDQSKILLFGKLFGEQQNPGLVKIKSNKFCKR